MISELTIQMKKKHTGTLLWRIGIKFKMATDEMFFVIVLKTLLRVFEHVYARPIPLPTCHKIRVAIRNVHNLMLAIARVLIDI